MAKNTAPSAANAATTPPAGDSAAADALAAGAAAQEGAAKTVKARVLVAGNYGKPDTVVTVTEAEAAASSELDAHPDAVAYAESLAGGASA